MKQYPIIVFLTHCFFIVSYNSAVSQIDLQQSYPGNLSGTLDSGFTSWQWLNPLPQGNDLYRVQMIDSNIIYAIGEYGTFISTTNCVNPQSISMQVLNGLYSGFTIDDLRRKMTDLDCVTLKQVNEAAKKYLTTNSFALVVVGSADTTRESLKVIGNFTEVYYKDPINK